MGEEHLMAAALTIIGTPLDDRSTLPKDSLATLEHARIIFAESRKPTLSLLAKSGLRLPLDRFVFLDPVPRTRELEISLNGAFENGDSVCLMSDTGMPILFDPGVVVLEIARRLGFQIRTLPTATSWATACAVSGFLPPFLIHGFLPQKSPDRLQQLRSLRPLGQHTVLMDAPYRFRTLVQEVGEVFGNQQPVFLAWEIAKPGERYFWEMLGSLLAIAERELPKKGEFILILRALGSDGLMVPMRPAG